MVGIAFVISLLLPSSLFSSYLLVKDAQKALIKEDRVLFEGGVKMEYEDRVMESKEALFLFGKRRLLLKSATLTTCKREKPHYSLFAKEASFSKERILAKGVVLTFLRLPIFYLPYLSYKKEQSPFHTKLGFDSKDGLKIRVRYSPSQSSSFLLDYIQRRGFGAGATFCLSKKSFLSKTTIYQMREKERRRWKVQSFLHLRKKDYKLDATFHYLSDAALGREVLDADFCRTYTRSYVSFVSQRPLFFQTLARFCRRWEEDKFVTEDAVAPALFLTTYTKRLPIPLYYRASASLENILKGERRLEHTASLLLLLGKRFAPLSFAILNKTSLNKRVCNQTHLLAKAGPLFFRVRRDGKVEGTLFLYKGRRRAYISFSYEREKVRAKIYGRMKDFFLQAEDDYIHLDYKGFSFSFKEGSWSQVFFSIKRGANCLGIRYDVKGKKVIGASLSLFKNLHCLYFGFFFNTLPKQQRVYIRVGVR